MVSSSSAIDYLTIGHITKDLQPHGFNLGGTVVYSGLTASMLGRRVGIVTATGADLALEPLRDLEIANHISPDTTTFKNVETQEGRQQYLLNRARDLDQDDIPEIWRSADIIHLGPVINEVDIELIRSLQGSITGVTPQGWLRRWSDDGRIYHQLSLPELELLSSADAVVISSEDVAHDSAAVDALGDLCKLLVVTSGAGPSLLISDGGAEEIPSREVEVIDPTGAGDIFAAAFFIKLREWSDPLRAASFAALVASSSVGRRSLEGPPTAEELHHLEAQAIQ